MTEPLLQAVELSCERDDRVLFRQLNVSIVPGTLTRVEGPNGSGKTTLLRIFAGLSDAFSGEILWQGRPRPAMREWANRNTLYLGHRAGIKGLLTPLENLRALTFGRQTCSEALLRDALDGVGLGPWADVPCQNLSAGQKRRVALARLLFSDEPLWILDEAFTALDVEAVAALERLLTERVREGGAVVMTTHHEPDLAMLQRVRLGDVARSANVVEV